jgi:CrcB protein
LFFGFLIQLAEAHDIFSGEAGMFVFVGVLGGFTTFSTFSNDSINLMRAGDNTSALISLSHHFLYLGWEPSGWDD